MPIVNGTTYHDEADPEVVRIIEKVRLARTRVRLYYGDVATGLVWGDGREPAERGTIGRSLGPVKIPILVANSRSTGGPGILERRIVRIEESPGGRVLYSVRPGPVTYKDVAADA